MRYTYHPDATDTDLIQPDTVSGSLFKIDMKLGISADITQCLNAGDLLRGLFERLRNAILKRVMDIVLVKFATCGDLGVDASEHCQCISLVNKLIDRLDLSL